MLVVHDAAEHSGSYAQFATRIETRYGANVKHVVFDLPGHGGKFVTKLDNGTYVAKPEQGYIGSTKEFNDILLKSLMYIADQEKASNSAVELYLMGHGMGASAVLSLLKDNPTLNTTFKALILSCKK